MSLGERTTSSTNVEARCIYHIRLVKVQDVRSGIVFLYESLQYVACAMQLRLIPQTQPAFILAGDDGI